MLDFSALSPDAVQAICPTPAGDIGANWNVIREEMFLADDLFWIGWKDTAVGLLDPDYLYPNLQNFFEIRGVGQIQDFQRAAVLDIVAPGWRDQDYYQLKLDAYQTYIALLSIARGADKELMIYDVGADGWGFLNGPADAHQTWANWQFSYVTIFTIERFFGVN